MLKNVELNTGDNENIMWKKVTQNDKHMKCNNEYARGRKRSLNEHDKKQ